MWYNINIGAVAQLVEQRPEEPCVTGSSPVGATRFYIARHFRRFFSGDIIYSMKTEKSCGCIILKDNQVLLIGAKDDGGKLFWSFPKGHQENDETGTETAIRETKEETGLDVEISDKTYQALKTYFS